MNAKRITFWIAVADSAKARVFESEGPSLTLQLVEELDSEGARRPSRELMSDRQGRTQNSAAPGGAAMENTSNPQDVEKHKFVRLLVDYLEAAAHRGKFDALVLVAAPRTLGELRKLMPPTLSAKIHSELDKDLTNLPQPELTSHLKPLEIGKPKLG